MYVLPCCLARTTVSDAKARTRAGDSTPTDEAPEHLRETLNLDIDDLCKWLNKIREVSVMLFMVHHKHTAEMCPAGKVRPDKEFVTRFAQCFKETGLKLEGYIDGPGHEFYFVIDVDDIKKLYEVMKDLLQMGDNKVVPVVRFSDAAALAKKLGLQK